MFVLKSIFLGFGLAMDAFSVSIANGLNDSQMSKKRAILIAGTFAGFQFLMPVVGWLIVHTLATAFHKFEVFIPLIALGLLGYIGGKMIYEGFKKNEEEEAVKKLSLSLLLLQGVATSIDALSTGFVIADYSGISAFFASLIIAAVTFGVCMVGLLIGKKVGMKLSNKASVLGGAILIFIGLEIFISHIF